MTRTRLYGPAQLLTSPSLVYLCPSLTTTTILQIDVSNPTGSAQTFTFSIGTDSTGDRVYDTVTVSAGSRLSIKCYYVLAAGEYIQAAASSASVVLILSGQENHLSAFYTYDFLTTETPLSSGGVWQNNGLDWTVVQVSGGIAFGTQTGTTGPPYNDSYAHILGFPANHQSIVTIHRNGTIDSTTREAECLVRWADAPHVARGYEFNYAWDGAYCGIVRWNGALNDFTPIGSSAPNGALAEGDLLRLDASGSQLTAYRSTNGGASWTSVASATDSTWTDGNPGIGFWKDGGTDPQNDHLGATKFIASAI